MVIIIITIIVITITISITNIANERVGRGSTGSFASQNFATAHGEPLG